MGSKWNGIDFMRSLSGPRTGAPTQAQVDQQLKFALATNFLNSKRQLLDESFSTVAVKMTGANHALSHALKNAIIGVSPNFSIDYSKVLISKGGLFPPLGAKAVAGAAGQVAFSWNNLVLGSAKATDKAITVVYSEDYNVSVYNMAGAMRSTLADVMTIPAFSGKTVHTWLAFVSDDGSMFSDSLYAGQVNVL